MKSMILKDIYNITHNMRSLGLLLVMFVLLCSPRAERPAISLLPVCFAA